MFYILYKTTNLINGKIYVGVHKTTDLDDGYLGSGININRAIKKYGRENFKKEILEFFKSESEMYTKEKQIVNEQFIKQPHVYNIMEGGEGNFSYINSLPRQGHHPDQHKKASLKGNAAFKHKLANDSEFSKNFSNKISNTLKELHRTGELTRYNPMKGCRWMSNDSLMISKNVKLSEVDTYLKDGWYLGMKYKKPRKVGMKYKKKT